MILIAGLLLTVQPVAAQTPETIEDSAAVVVADSAAIDSIAVTVADDEALSDIDETEEDGGFHKQLKTKFIDGNVGFMSLVALALVLGLAFCIERILYLMMSEIKAKKLMEDIKARLAANELEGAKTLCRNTRGPVASVYYGRASWHPPDRLLPAVP